MINTHALGIKGEQLAVDYLKKKKYEILERNYTTKIGEIDIIAKLKNKIIFVEVKQRESLKYGYPREAITSYKINKIRRVAEFYLKRIKQMDLLVQFDCIEILGEKITHIENCF